MSSLHKSCQHRVLQLEPSAFAELAGFERADARKRYAATTKSGRAPAKSGEKAVETAAVTLSQSFPGPLVLPFDELNHDPKWPPQSMRSWLNEKERNKPTQERKTIYVAAVPKITKAVGFMEEWLKPNLAIPASSELEDLVSPDVMSFVDYIGTFYQGMPVKQFARPLQWVPWTEKYKSKTKSKTDLSSIPKFIGLSDGDKMTRIRARAPPDGLFEGQLNLNDILDFAISVLPADAYSIILLVDHDLHEDDDDDYCCGRAYGGSRICVVQTARYHPILDQKEKIDHQHQWPTSHCKDYVDSLCALEDVKPTAATGTQIKMSLNGPIRAAINAASGLPPPSTIEEFQALWFGRLARTAVHELGHCMGMDHCVYYACIMQGTAGMAEDGRQSPYLCPVCLGKISHALACELQGEDEVGRMDYVRKRYAVIAEICTNWERNGLFAGYGAWARARLEDLENER
jgi:archaemetzincin